MSAFTVAKSLRVKWSKDQVITVSLLYGVLSVFMFDSPWMRYESITG